MKSVACVGEGCELAAQWVAILWFPSREHPQMPPVGCKHVDVVVCGKDRKRVTATLLMADPARIEAAVRAFAREGRGRTPDLNRPRVSFARMQ